VCAHSATPGLRRSAQTVATPSIRRRDMGVENETRKFQMGVLRKNNILMALDVTAPNRDNRQERSPIP
jgi:hypothetical protein